VTLVVFALLLLPVEGVTRKKRKAAAESVTQGKRVHADVTELQTDVTNLPERCTVKTKNGDTVEMHYRGYLTNGREFDSSYSRGTPFEFKIGAGTVIAGWDKGLLDMCVNEKRQLRIPPSLAYGESGRPPVIPRSATLIFDVELVAIQK